VHFFRPKTIFYKGVQGVATFAMRLISGAEFLFKKLHFFVTIFFPRLMATTYNPGKT
jgi:hypothetical protein